MSNHVLWRKRSRHCVHRLCEKARTGRGNFGGNQEEGSRPGREMDPNREGELKAVILHMTPKPKPEEVIHMLKYMVASSERFAISTDIRYQDCRLTMACDAAENFADGISLRYRWAPIAETYTQSREALVVRREGTEL